MRPTLKAALGWLVCLLATPLPAFATSFTFQSPVGDACLPNVSSGTPIIGSGSCYIPFFPDTLGGTEERVLLWRADYTSLGLAYKYDVSGTASVGPWGLDSGTNGFATAAVVDQLTVTGGTGAGVLRIGIDVSGNEVVIGGNYSTFAQLQIVTNAIASYGPGTSEADIPFTYGTPFSLTRDFVLGVQHLGLSGNVGPWGPYGASGNYFNSAEFTFTVLDTELLPVDGATITSESGFLYPQGSDSPTPVPEPASLLLLGSGLLLLAVRARKSQ